MTRTIKLAGGLAALLLPVFSVTAAAQTSNAGVTALEDEIEDIQRDARRAINRAQDEARFGNEEFTPGWSGSLSASFNATSGNTDSEDIAVAGRLRYGAGRTSHDIGLALEWSEDDGIRNEERAFLFYDMNYMLDDRFYLFALGRLEVDEFGPLETDAFIGVGPGYRVVNTPQVAWRLQAGPGVRYVEPQGATSETEVAGIVSSRLFFRINDEWFLTNDTDMLSSDTGTLTSNDFGVSYAMSDVLTARLGYRTEYNSRSAPGTSRHDDTLNLSLIYSFN